MATKEQIEAAYAATSKAALAGDIVEAIIDAALPLVGERQRELETQVDEQRKHLAKAEAHWLERFDEQLKRIAELGVCNSVLAEAHAAVSAQRDSFEKQLTVANAQLVLAHQQIDAMQVERGHLAQRAEGKPAGGEVADEAVADQKRDVREWLTAFLAQRAACGDAPKAAAPVEPREYSDDQVREAESATRAQVLNQLEALLTSHGERHGNTHIDPAEVRRMIAGLREEAGR